ncbi:hypothetical protein [Cytobacillus gottheilii]|uniref:hypothetical protein n=1 Tax=Cytobacillus gottheilii TaxID=859144 RepID=UPI0009BB6BBD|nr:hypothetical protein [Cytobacillus gottheilii]
MKPLKLLFMSVLFALLLAGCGTADQAEETENSSADQNTETEESQDQTDRTQGEENQTPDPSEADEPMENGDENDSDQMIRLMEQNLQYEQDGEMKEETAFLKNSDNMNYSLYVLPDYELTGEEPNKDVLFFKEDDHHFMRIELIPEGQDEDMLEENTIAQLEAVSEDVQSIDPPQGEAFQNTKGFTADNGEDAVAAYIIHNDQADVKISIFSKTGAQHQDAFLKMAATIMEEG